MAPLFDSPPHPACRAAVILPARDEERSLGSTLDALAAQVGEDGRPFAPRQLEILLLLNNCSDDSAAVARRWQREHPEVAFHIAERVLAREDAHVGTARRWLMDTAWHRLVGQHAPVTGILSTDADTRVAPDWIRANLLALAEGADAVGGMICLPEDEVAALPPGARECYRLDRRFERVVAELEHLLDPQSGDPWPRHLQHFGASLACSPRAYARAGGLPVRRTLEDVAFVDALRRVDASLRHDPAVVVHTSARLEGRVEVGLSAQLRLWQREWEAGKVQTVQSAAFLAHRFRTLRCLRLLHRQGSAAPFAFSPAWHKRLAAAQAERLSPAAFLAEIDCDRLVAATFTGLREQPIGAAIAALAGTIRTERERQHTPGPVPHMARPKAYGSEMHGRMLGTFAVG